MMLSMSNKFSIKASEKLPRGSYFYIQVGHRFFSGFSEMSQTREIGVIFPPITFYTKDGKTTPELEKYHRQKYGFYSQKSGPRRRRAARDRRKGSLPSYSISPPQPPSKINIREKSGLLEPRLSDSLDQAKRYRRLSQAKNACEKLKRSYGSLVTNIQVRFYQGETL